MRTITAASLVLSLAVAASGEARLETADARIVSGQLLSIAGGRIVLQGDKQKHSLALDGVVEVFLLSPEQEQEQEDPMTKLAQKAVLTALGDRLIVDELAVSGRRLRARCALLGQSEMPMDLARVIYLPDFAESPDELEKRYREMKLPAAVGDRLLVRKQAREVLAVDGVLEAIDAKQVTFRWRDQSRKVERANVPMVRLAAVRAKTPATGGLLLGRDGSIVHFVSLALDKGVFTLDSPAVGKQSIPLARAAALRITSDKVTALAELKPSSVKERGYFQTTFHHRVDLAVSGKPLRLGGRTYRTGLGLHSHCELVYSLARQYAAFVATVGIDDAVRPNGDATLTFLGDGRSLAKPIRLTGKTPPRVVRLDVKGVERLLIRVDFGTDQLGVADHVDLAGARLIK